jgi:stress-induced morphogen
MTAYHSLRLFQIVSKYIPNQDDSRDFVTEVEAVVRDQLQMETNTLATKSELFQVKDELRKEIHQFRDELKGDIHALRDELKGDIHALRDELKGDMHVLRAELKGDIHALRDELKGDIYRLEVRMELGFKDQLKWIILLMLGFSSLIITVVKFL